ncbi:hypothetical protein [Streptomyces sp. CB01881]|uniref:hypothetical protein n=1 Tax=Streptomyces sp. CB01881 TaxID=2078691 RepID=UPI00129C1B1A|nr:hypothetical protein [Streptomyces sp. CB01881]
MSSRRALLAVAAAAAAVTLTACGPGDPEPATTAAGPTPANTAAPAPTGGATATGKPTGAAPTSPAAASSAGKPSGGATGGCLPPGIPSNHRMVNLSKAATATTVHAKDTTYLCGKPTGGWIDAGEEKTYTFAPGATAKLSDLNNMLHAVPLAQFAAHTDFCLNHTSAPDTEPCYDRGTHEIVLDGSGRITNIVEVGLVKQVVTP